MNIDRRHKTRLSSPSAHYRTAVREPIIIVLEDKPFWSAALEHLCDFLDIRIEAVDDVEALRTAMRDQRPMAVLSEMESAAIDGCDVLKLVGAHDPELPVMLRTDGDPVLTGAGEAMQDVLGLSGAQFVPDLPAAGEMMAFLFRAGQRGRCLGLMPA